ncbi:MAG: zinc ribbon domain-containing protein [Polyangiaceae bacterium]
MNDDHVTTLLEGLIIVQYVVPLLLGGPLLVPSIFDKLSAKSVAEESAEEKSVAAKASALAPLMCPGCGAPVPLESASFPCPHCHAQITPPDAYVHTLELRKHAVIRLKRAERKWRWSRWTSSPLVTIPMRLFFVSWFVVIVWAAFVVDWPGLVLLLAAILAGFELAGGWFYASYYASARKTLPALPAVKFLKAPTAAGACAGCGAPIQFPADTFATICMYCGADNYREALAQAAQADAGSQVRAAKKSLRDAVKDLDDRRGELIAFVGLMVVAELFYGAFFIVGSIYDAVFGD